MKTVLNKILLKLAESELANPNISPINEQAWDKLKGLFKRDKYDYNKTTSSAREDNDGDVINIANYIIDPPMEYATIDSPWGKWRPAQGRRHLGIDMRTDPGTPVYAVRPGTVVKIGDDPTGWGTYVITKHEPFKSAATTLGETFYALYAHLSNISVSVGSELDFGTVIGKSGGAFGTPGAGNSSGPHLHFEIKTSEEGGSIDPVKFYAKYGNTFENQPIQHYKSSKTTKNIKSPDYIVNPESVKTSTIVPIETEITNDVKNDIISGETVLDGFKIYMLPGDETYMYGIPTDELPNVKYDWWTVSDTLSSWVSLKSKLSPNKYNKALSILNTAFPGALDLNKLDTTTTVPIASTSTSANRATTQNKPTSTAKNKKSVFSYLVKGTVYTSDSVLKNKPTYKLYNYNSTQKKFIHASNGKIDATDSIIYLGHDSENNYMYVQIVSAGIDPGNKNKYWISVNDIELKK
jgi:hypothetical protein